MADSETSRGIPTWLKWSIIGVLAVVIVGYGAIFLYAKVINDSPDELDESDLDAALAADDTTPDTATDTATESSPPADTLPADDAAAATTVAPTTPAAETGGDGVWAVTDASEFGYRVKEVLFGVDTDAVGRSNEITGSLEIESTQVTVAEFEVDVASIKSNESRRDGRFANSIMSTGEFPTATFVLTEPIELGAEPSDGLEVVTNATGELTLRGVTNPVSFEVTAKLENGKIGVLGSIPVVFADYSIANPSTGGITTEDEGLVEFVLVYEPAS